MVTPEYVAQRRALAAAVTLDRPVHLPTDERLFVDLLHYHGVAGRAWRRAHGSAWGDGAAHESLRRSHLDAAHHHLRSMATLHRVAAVMESHGVPWAVMKGPVLAERMYDDVAERAYRDIDVLVSPRHLSIALDRLQESSFRLLDRNWTLLRERTLGQLHLLSPDGVIVDLHWHLVNRPELRSRVRLDTDELLERRRTVTVGGRAVPTLGSDDTVVHLAAHGALAGGHRLVWLMDLSATLLREPGEAARVASLARSAGVAGAVTVMVARCGRVLGSDTNDLLEALSHPALAASACSLLPHWERPHRGGPARWLARAALGGGPTTLARTASQLATAVRRRAADDRRSPSVFTSAGARSDLRQYLDVVATAGATGRHRWPTT